MEVRGGLFYFSLCSWIVFPVCPFLRISVTQFPYHTQFPCRLTFCPTFCDPVFCCVCAQSRLNSFVNPWTDYTARQAPLSVGFSRQEYGSGLPFPPPGDLPDPGIKAIPQCQFLMNCVITTVILTGRGSTADIVLVFPWNILCLFYNFSHISFLKTNKP